MATRTKKTTKKKSARGGRRRRVAVDQDVMRKDRKRTDKTGEGADLYQIPEGDTLLWILPPVHESEPRVYVEFQAHFGVGPNSRMVVNLEHLEDHEPLLDAFEKSKKIDLEDARVGWEFMGEHDLADTERSKLKPRWAFNVVPMQFRRNKRAKWEPSERDPCMIAVGKQIYNGITDIMFDQGDITDPDAAILVQVNRKGTKLNTEYAVTVHADSLRDPIEIDDELWERVEKYLEPGGEGDIYRQLVLWCRTEEEIEGVIEGREDDDDDDDDEPKSKRRRSTKVRTASSRRRSRKRDPEPEEDDEELEEEDDEEEEEKPRRKSRKRRKAPEPEPEEDDDEEEEEEEEEEDDEDLEDDDEDDEDLEDDEEEEDDEDEEEEEPEPEPTPRRRKRPSRSKAKKKPEPEPEDEEEEEDDDAEALEAALKKRKRRRRK